ncbi:hypothetical protein [Parasulfitobacter algicola]|uniref:Uncharacterized protein n=1 Tax=Parasulfitobacter algicola TaxID=2614809 RepID=A0ABX2ITV3_9RHOB|nr:hypothetical protein [Sulfitobacter algicola]NSX56326.1 hypothetical protein [Sulfitobacter algicola]
MEIFKRSEAVERLLSDLDIPRLEFFYELKQGIGPYDPEFFEKSAARRKDFEAKAKQALLEMTDEELWELRETPRRLSSFALKYSLFDPPPWYAAGFGVCVYQADFEYWAKMDFWTLEEAICLSLGFNPEKVPNYRNRPHSRYETVQLFRQRMSLIERAPFNAKSQQNSVTPSVFTSWAVSKEMEIPSELIDAVGIAKKPNRPAMLTTVDKRQHDTALKVILGLLASIYADEQTLVTREVKSDISLGLAKIGLSLDPKTLTKLLNEAVLARKRFESEQQIRDDKAV